MHEVLKRGLFLLLYVRFFLYYYFLFAFKEQGVVVVVRTCFELVDIKSLLYMETFKYEEKSFKNTAPHRKTKVLNCFVSFIVSNSLILFYSVLLRVCVFFFSVFLFSFLVVSYLR